MWQKLVSEPDEMLIELINDTLEKLSGYKADAATVVDFLRNEHFATPNVMHTSPAPKKSVVPVSAVVELAEPHSIKLNPDALRDLLHTKVIEAKMCGNSVTNNWRSILHAGLLLAFEKGMKVDTLREKLRINFKEGVHTEQGFGPLEGTHYSWQNQDANKTAANIVKIVRLLNCELLILLEWREKGKFPLQKGLIHVTKSNC
ncbi:MAG: hypothetical protein ACR2IH_05905 [Pyrinomonadaceae bacterium]